jgi:hypothetical protein
MRIGFDVSQTGSGKAGCGYYAHASLVPLWDSVTVTSLLSTPVLEISILMR